MNALISSFEGVCVETTVIFAQGREEWRSETAHDLGGLAGFQITQTLHWPAFYARPLSRSESGSFFLKKTLLVRVLCTFFYFCDTSRLKTRFFTIFVKT